MKTKKLLSILLIFALMFCLCSCGVKGFKKKADLSNAEKLSFKSALSYEKLKELNNKAVTINGYLATSSPADGSFIFLMNLPYQSCPFCKPNTSQLSNTIEVYPPEGDSFSYTNQAVKVTGILEVAESEDKPFTDDYGYEFSFKITEAEYKIISAEELGEEYKLWTKIADSNVMDELNQMLNYLSFVCTWNTYSVKSWTDENGNEQPGYYLYANDAINHLTKSDGQYNYGYQDGYFDKIIKDIKAIDENEFSDLIKIVEDAKALAEKAVDDLMNGRYSYENKYVEQFGTYDDIYTLDNEEELNNQYEEIYYAYAEWMGSWEM